ncbi:AraC family transcriptional regulator [Starkeya koreensis]|uniref:AraC family transcriptional regulator n=1 Tax=Ancylobacter koreensis TaxID=266121 RepID=A0ABT0DM37_9HYPH|nr:AraC family transcriptional regulator [Ancylobacter koreensis]MCK0208342.1 AraC family transcriptional regulator [Ancylobacter koreensis]
MAPPSRLYERAPHVVAPHAVAPPAVAAPAPLWHLDPERTCFIGRLTYNAPHQHGAPVFLAGLYGRFGLRLAGGDWQWVRTAMIPAGVVHELNVGGDPIAVLYIEPTLEGAPTLAALTASTAETGGALAGKAGEFALLREMWEDAGSIAWAGAALDDLVGFGAKRARRPVDPRVARILESLTDRADDGSVDGPGVAAACAQVGLSPHHFQHLFTREVGVPYRRYRAWTRMRRAIATVSQGSSLTRAAHEAGFCDQAHFTHDFRRTFGAPPSWSLSGVRLSTDPARRRPAAPG